MFALKLDLQFTYTFTSLLNWIQFNLIFMSNLNDLGDLSDLVVFTSVRQILPKMQKINCYIKSELPSSNKQDHAFKKLKRLTRERLNKVTFLFNLWHQISKYYVNFSSETICKLGNAFSFYQSYAAKGTQNIRHFHPIRPTQ